MKYELTTSISTKYRLFTSKVNFAVTIAFRYALRATYFITQRAEAHLLGATQRKEASPQPSPKGKGVSKSLPLGGDLEEATLRSKQGLRLCSLRRNLEPSWMAWIEVYDCCKFTCIKT
ncbi:MAG: hypothetical protein MJY52_05410 [Bacteroidaceae bacterium]|nr:hypothetical protein [Bacteroidaceae bacterium]